MYAVYLTIYKGLKLPPYYVGSTSLKKIENGYRGSVVSKKYKDTFKKELSENFDLFEVIILSRHNTRKEAIEMELRIQKKLDVVKSDIFFNEAYASINGMFGRDVSGANNPMFGKKQKEDTKRLIREKRGTDKRYDPTEAHKKITSLTHKGKIVNNETRVLISKNRKGKNCGVDNPMFGQTHTDEVKKKISESNTGRTHSVDTKNKLSIINKGKILTKEAKRKISDSKKGKKRKAFSLEWKKNLSESKKGKTMSEESKQKLINTKTGMKYKERTCLYCGKTGSGGNMLRYHFDNCKLKNK